MNSVPLAEVGVLLVIELDGGRVYLDDGGELFALPAHAAIRDRLVDALIASGARPGSSLPLPLLTANRMARDGDRPPGPRPHRQSSEIHRPRLGRARRRRRLVFRPQDDTAEHEVGDKDATRIIPTRARVY